MKYICKEKFSVYLTKANEIVDIMPGVIFDVLDEYTHNVYGKVYRAKLRSGLSFLISEEYVQNRCEKYEEEMNEKEQLQKTMFVIKDMVRRINEMTEELNILKICLDDLESVLEERGKVNFNE